MRRRLADLPPSATRGQAVLAALAVLLTAADAYVVVLALPDIMAGVGVGLEELQRATPIISGFLLGYVAALPLIGRLSDLYGRLPALVGCLLVFALGSLFTASADGLLIAVTGRALQGVGGGGLVPVTLALVADRWPPERRGVPLGVVGAAQEIGGVLGPLYGGAILAVTSWRAIFWVNLTGALALTLALLGTLRRGRADEGSPPARPAAAALFTAIPGTLATAALVLLVTQPGALVDSVRFGGVYVPLVDRWVWSSPLALLTLVLAAAAAGRLWSIKGIRRLVGAADLLGALLLATALAGLVLAFAAADPSRQVVADQAVPLVAGSALCAGLFVWRQRRAAHPLVPASAVRPTAAWGALAVNFCVGAALIAALVDVPIFARVTRYPHSQLGAALVLVEFLVALPAGALVGGWLCQRLPPRAVAGGGMTLAAMGFVGMARWDQGTINGTGSTVVLVLTGLGFGLTIAPVNVALLAATDSTVHGIASALAVVARTVGMLVGLAVLTALGLRIFFDRQARIGSPLTRCPRHPGDCPAYVDATRAALVSELHAIFWGAALCAVMAAALAAGTLRHRPCVDD